MKVNAGWVPGVTIGVGYLASLVMYPDLPGPLLQSSLPPALVRPLVAFALPTAATVTYLILRRLSGEPPAERVIDAESEAAHRGIAVRLVVFIMALHVLVLLTWAAFNGSTPGGLGSSSCCSAACSSRLGTSCLARVPIWLLAFARHER